MTNRHFVVTVTPANLTKHGQTYVASVDGREVYRGRHPYFDGARAMVDDHGYQLDDLVSYIRYDGTRSEPIPINSLYWTEVTESDKGGLRCRAWRGMTQDAICRWMGVTKDARESKEGTQGAPDTESTPGGPSGGEGK